MKGNTQLRSELRKKIRGEKKHRNKLSKMSAPKKFGYGSVMINIGSRNR